MFLFVDESGSFAVPRSPSSPSVCCMAVLTVPDGQLQEVVDGFLRIVQGWRLGSAEPKGSSLSERRIDRVITHLTNYNVVLVLVSIDMALHTNGDIDTHRKGQAAIIRRSADGPGHKESMRKSVREVADRVEALSNQLYVQSVALTLATWRVTQIAKTHYAQTDPGTLGRFSWRIDAKDRSVTEAEDLWGLTVKAMQQTMSLRDGLISVVDPRFDYSVFDAAFENPVADGPPAHLAKGMRTYRTGPFHSVSVNKIMDTDRKFEDSRGNPGLQMVDIVASGYRRAMNGRLREPGWRRLGRLLVRDFHDDAVRHISLKPRGAPVPRIGVQPYAVVAKYFEDGARPWEVGATQGQRRPILGSHA